MPYVYLFVGMLCFGWSNCLWRPLQSQGTTERLIFLRSLWTVPLIALTGGILAKGIDTNSLQIAFAHLPYILLSLVGLWSFVSSMKYQQTGISGSIILYIGFFGSLVAWVFTDDKLPVYFGFTAILYGIGLALLSPGSMKNVTPWRGTVLALLAALCWAFANLGVKQGIERVGFWNLSLMQECTVLCTSGLLHLYTRKPPPVPSGVNIQPNTYSSILPLSLLTIGGVVFTNIALGELPVLHFALITMTQPITTLLVSAVIYKEQLSRRQWTGSLLLIAGSVLCSLN